MSETTHYQGSKGAPQPIAAMPFPYLKNAYDKLLRANDPLRAPELVAMKARLSVLEAEHEAKEGVLPADHLPGANMPPPDAPPQDAPAKADGRPYEAIKAHIDDLYGEAKNWLDGAPIATAAQADEVARLLDLMRQAHKGRRGYRAAQPAAQCSAGRRRVGGPIALDA